ncbi:hypothetical protein OAS39_12065 [Pirellulales bacterium]|nr:hypothetical protein [Pirellulales bacterium]
MLASLEKIVAALNAQQVEFILIGGWAAVVHGSARATVDVDIVYRRTGDNIQKLVAALAPCEPYLRGAPPGLPFKWDEPTIRQGLDFTLTTSVGDLDVLGERLPAAAATTSYYRTPLT